MPNFCEAMVSGLVMERRGLQRIHVRRDDVESDELAYVLTDLVGSVSVGDRVVINTTAIDHGLGTGGAHVVHWNLSRHSWQSSGGGHVMKLRYLSSQIDCGVDEERTDAIVPQSLAGVVVVGCILHSQVAAVAAAIKHLASDISVAYVMTDQASLPLPLSDLVAEMKERELIDATVTAGQAFGGDYEAVNVESGLHVAAQRAHAQVIIVGDGPGVVGTGTQLGFSSMSVARSLNGAVHDGAITYLSLRWSDADERDRHQGLSHHSTTLLQRTSANVRVAIPSHAQAIDTVDHDLCVVDVPDMSSIFSDLGFDVRTMGRSVRDDPAFFTWAAAAGVAAVRDLAG